VTTALPPRLPPDPSRQATVDDRNDVISLQDYLTVLRRQKWLIAVVVVLTVGAAIAVSMTETPMYEAESELVVEPLRRSGDATLEQLLQLNYQAVETERLVVTSRPVATRAAASLGVSDPSRLVGQVEVETVRDTSVVRITAQHPDPVTAASIADAFAEGYLEYRRDVAVDQLLAAAATLEDRGADLRAQIDALDAEIAEDEENGALAVQRDALVAQLAQVLAQASELGDSAEDVTGGGMVLTPAEVPQEPVSPQPVRTAALALVLGLLLGIGLAFLRDHLDDVIRDEDDFRRATGGRPILGRIPNWSDPQGADRLATVVAPNSIVSESYRELSAGVRFLLRAQDDHPDGAPAGGGARGAVVGRAVLVTSASAGDGKTSTAANLAVSAARVGLRTLLIDADLRRPTVGKRLGLGRTTGLSDLLLAGDALEDHLLEVGVDELHVLPAGMIPPNPNELLASAAMRELERDVRQRFDLVVYDSPAVLAVPDALELGRHVDVAIMVGRAGRTGRRHLSSAIERLHQVGAEVAGTVLNGISSKDDGYYYSYYYGEPNGTASGEADGGDGEHGAGPLSRRARRSAQHRDGADVDDGRGGLPLQVGARPRKRNGKRRGAAESAASTSEAEDDEALFSRRDG
jgi:polysaccharide biosynthesis transport protein